MVKAKLLRCYEGALKELRGLGVDADKVHNILRREGRRITAIDDPLLSGFTETYDHTVRIAINKRILDKPSLCSRILAHEILHDVGKLPDHHPFAKIWANVPRKYLAEHKGGRCSIMGDLWLKDPKCFKLDPECKEILRKKGLLVKPKKG